MGLPLSEDGGSHVKRIVPGCDEMIFGAFGRDGTSQIVFTLVVGLQELHPA